jgi:hypothetical protein
LLEEDSRLLLLALGFLAFGFLDVGGFGKGKALLKGKGLVTGNELLKENC